MMPIRTALPVVLRSAVVGAAFVLTGCGAPAVTTSAPAVQLRENVEGLLGRNILFLEPEEQILAYRNVDLLAPTRSIPAGGDPYPLPSAPVELSSVTYTFNDSTRALADLAERTNLTGLLVIREGEIVLEEYFRGNTAETRWTSFSVAKSVVSLLFGAAIRDGYMESVEEPVTRYLPELAGSAYEGVTIRQILQMSSGVAWNEDYADPGSDVARIGQLSEASKPLAM
ncbi:MAG: beta-lactamase family protein [Acidobacteria bacterium]|nr:beta-lactamase family protein [Acidobacteriota bacterium]